MPKANNPFLWDSLLRHQLAQYNMPSATVAGGAVRDYVFNKDVKDIDIFVREEEFMNSGVLGQWGADPPRIFANDAYPGGAVRLHPNEAGYDERFTVYNVASVLRVYPPIQFILVNGSVHDHIQTFDIEICKMWFRNNEVHMTEGALRGFKSNWSYYEEGSEERVRYLRNERGYDDVEFISTRGELFVA